MRLFTHTGYFFAISSHHLIGTKKEEQSAEMVKESMISDWISMFGAPGILMVGKDSRVIGENFQDSPTSHNIILQTAIPGHHQSLGAAERRRRLFRTIIDHFVGDRKPRKN